MKKIAAAPPPKRIEWREAALRGQESRQTGAPAESERLKVQRRRGFASEARARGAFQSRSDDHQESFARLMLDVKRNSHIKCSP